MVRGVLHVLLLLECGGLLGIAVSGWNMPADPIWWMPALILSCLLFTGFYRWDKLEGKRRYGVFLFVLVYAVVLFLTQNAFTSGAKQFLNAAVSAANQQYHSSVELFSVSGSAADLNLFLAELTVLFAFVLGAVSRMETGCACACGDRVPSSCSILPFCWFAVNSSVVCTDVCDTRRACGIPVLATQKFMGRGWKRAAAQESGMF